MAQALAHADELQPEQNRHPRKRNRRQTKAAGAELRQLGQANLRPLDRRFAGTADQPVSGHSRHAAQCAQPAGRRLPRDAGAHCPLPRASKGEVLTRRAWQLFRALVERGDHRIASRKRRTGQGASEPGFAGGFFDEPDALAWRARHPAARWTQGRADYALVVLTFVESILEDPDLILRRQLNKVKDRAIAEMKMQGVDYNQRMEELEKPTPCKPNRDFICSTFNAFTPGRHLGGPGSDRPKSIAREMFEEFRSFADYIKLYDLQRAEGLLLRHLSSVYKVLTQTVPDAAKNDALRKWNSTSATMLRQIDSSLLEEWEKMLDPNYRPRGEQPEVRPPGADEAAADITRGPEGVYRGHPQRLDLHRHHRQRRFPERPSPRSMRNFRRRRPVDRRATLTGARGIPHRARASPPIPRRARSSHLRHGVRRPASLARAAMLIDPEEANDWPRSSMPILRRRRATGSSP